MYYKYTSLSDQKQYAQKSAKKLTKLLNRPLNPILINSPKLVTSWWGIMWNKNLERYADFASRISRGKTYVKNNLVIDLDITSGLVKAYVQGSNKTPYQVTVTISHLPIDVIDKIKKQCQGMLHSLDELIEGNFPKAIAEIFTAEGGGLFPSPHEIKFYCSCPDWANCCKHVSAVLYGIGTRLDSDPRLFFLLRGIDLDDFLKEIINDKTSQVLKKGRECESKRVMKNINIGDIFNIDFEE